MTHPDPLPSWLAEAIADLWLRIGKQRQKREVGKLSLQVDVGPDGTPSIKTFGPGKSDPKLWRNL